MKKFLVLFVLNILGSGFLFAQQTKKPNILVIISDDHAYQTISAYGSNIAQTPNIDRLANEAAVFQNAYVTNSICGPSRAAFLSGKYSHWNGFKDNENSNFNFNQNTFTKDLQKAGYQTAWIGKMHLGYNTPQGFDYYNILPGQGHYYNPDFIATGGIRKRYEGYVTHIVTDLAEQWLNERDKSKPFCLVIGHKATHRTWMPDLADLGRFDNRLFPLPPTFYDKYATRKAAQVQDMSIAKTMVMGNDLKMYSSREEEDKEGNISRMTAVQRKVWNTYYDKIKEEYDALHLSGNALIEWKFQRYMKDYLATAYSLDKSVGHVLDYLDKKDLAKNTIVIYMSDQGFYMGEHGWFDKRFMYEQSFRTPMLMRYPHIIKPGTKYTDMIMNVDLAPTLLQATNTAVPDSMQGQSFLPLLKNQKYTPKKAIYYHYYENGEHAVSPHFGIKTNRYKLIGFYKRVNSWELFDLKKDPDELNNIYSKKSSHELVRKLKYELLNEINRLHDDEAKRVFFEKIN